MLSEEQWLIERRKGISGSDISAIMGVNEYTTPYKLWLEKTGRAENETETRVMTRGKILEPAVVKFWQEDSGFAILPESEESNKIIAHKDYPFLLGTPDRIYVDDQGNKGVLECKTTLLNINPDELPYSWFCQIQWYMGITGCEIGEVSCLGKFFKVDRVQYNFVPDFFYTLVEKAIEFRENHILADVPPEPLNEDDIKAMFRKHVDGKFIECGEMLADVVNNLKAIKAQIKQLEAIEEEEAKKLKMVLKDSEGMSYMGCPILTWKAAKDSLQFDKESFKAAHPELYQQFQKLVPGSRRFLVK